MQSVVELLHQDRLLVEELQLCKVLDNIARTVRIPLVKQFNCTDFSLVLIHIVHLRYFDCISCAGFQVFLREAFCHITFIDPPEGATSQELGYYYMTLP